MENKINFLFKVLSTILAILAISFIGVIAFKGDGEKPVETPNNPTRPNQCAFSIKRDKTSYGPGDYQNITKYNGMVILEFTYKDIYNDWIVDMETKHSLEYREYGNTPTTYFQSQIFIDNCLI